MLGDVWLGFSCPGCCSSVFSCIVDLVIGFRWGEGYVICSILRVGCANFFVDGCREGKERVVGD